MLVVFCDNGLGGVDSCYSDEYQACKDLGIDTYLVSYSNLIKGLKPSKKLVQPVKGIYRGWMLTIEQYSNLYTHLLECGIELINSPCEYEYAHHLPSNYETIKEYTPLTTYKPLKGKYCYKHFKKELECFKGKSIVIKDYVKSQKHYWNEACFIPNVSDWKNLNKVIKRFIELQDVDFVEGLVFREFIPFEKLTNHSISSMPLTKEFRIFVLNQKIVAVYQYWDEGNYEDVVPCLDRFKHLFKDINSCFFSMDIAKSVEGNWMIVEIGDGQVTGLPNNTNKLEFYKKLKND